MFDVVALKKALMPLLHAAAHEQPGLARVSLPCKVRDSDWLLWLAQQPLYPQLYWLSRNQEEAVAACGALKVLTTPEQGTAFLQQHNDPAVRLWGLNAFDRVSVADDGDAASFVFLPRVALFRSGEQVELIVHLYSETSLQDDITSALHDVERLIAPFPVEFQDDPKILLSSAASKDASCASASIPPVEESSNRSERLLTNRVIQTRHAPDQTGWHDLILQALEAIEQRQFTKVVLARRTTLDLDEALAPADFLAASRAVNRDCYHFMMAFSPEQAFVGSSPERLYRREGHCLETEALAGTVACGNTEAERESNAQWLLHDAKNQHENSVVVEDICQRLQDGAYNISVQHATIVSLRKVQHLRRRIQASLRDANDADCLRRLQPTAAVCGLPREAARGFLLSAEPFERGWYAGSVGFMSLALAEYAVSLRSALIERDRLYLYAGAGIVAGSNPHQEWLEIENKAAGLRTLLP